MAIPTNINGLTVTSIGEEAFYDATKMTSVTIPISVTNIGEDAFGNCANLTAITVAPQNAFYSSTNGVLFDKNVTTLVEYPGGLIGSYTIPSSVTSIGTNAFNSCNLISGVTIPSSVTSIGDLAFEFCKLASVTIPVSVTSIGGRAFYGDDLTNVTIPSSVTNIGEGPFLACNDLTTITVAPQNSFYSSTNGVLFDKSFTILIQYPDGVAGSYTIPSSVTNIGEDAFCVCYNLTSITIPNGVINIGEEAFQACISLTNVTIANGLTSIGDYAFEFCYGLTSVTISGSVTNIGDLAFAYCTSLASVCFKGNVPTFGFDVFFDDNAMFYYLPLIQANGASFGVQSNQFGFNITGTTNGVIVVEACTNLASPVWTRLQTNTLTNGSFYFSEPVQTNASGHYYRISSPWER